VDLPHTLPSSVNGFRINLTRVFKKCEPTILSELTALQGHLKGTV